MHFICVEEKPLAETSLPQQIHCKSCQGISTIQLYLEERWIEPIHPIKCPLSLLCHQTMSILAATGALSSAALAQRIFRLSPFIY